MLKKISVSIVVLVVAAVAAVQIQRKLNPPNLSFNEILFQKKNIFGFDVKPLVPQPEFYIFNFWASWCPPCVEETPSLLRFVENHNGRYQLFSLSQDSSMKEIDSFLKLFPALKNTRTEIIWDDIRSLARKMLVEKLPETFIYHVQSKKIVNISGSVNWESREFEDYLKQQFEAPSKKD